MVIHLNNKGVSLLEVLLAVFVLGIAIGPMLDAIAPSIKSIATEEKTIIFTNQVRSTLSRLTGLDFATLDSHRGNPADLTIIFGSLSEAAKENFTYAGQNYSPVAAITDASGGTGGLLEITVSAGDVSFSTLKAKY
jgi:prepilin-type N-terminal cleavage/methylation domain-containing protein